MNFEPYDICFKTISLLQNNLQTVENVCNICGKKHYTQNCPDLSVGKHVHDTPQNTNMSRFSLPNGLYFIETNEGICVVTSQKFAKGCRFGPLLAEKSYVPLENSKFPLVIFQNPVYNDDPELENLFSIRNYYLNTNNENMCNWMIHVTPAKFSNEQNLMCFQLNNQIFYSAIHDIDIGDILKVWYAPNYATKMNTELLQSSPYEIDNNILRQVSISTYDNILEDNISQFSIYKNNDHNNVNVPEVSLPPINSLMRLSSHDDFSYETNRNLYSGYQNYQNPEDSPQQQLLYDNNNNNGQGGIGNLSLFSIASSDDLNNLFMNSCTELFNCSFDTSFTTSDFENDAFENTFIPEKINVQSTPVKNNKKKNGNNNNISKIRTPTYSCKICTKSYVALCNLNKHMQTHDLFLCNLCMKNFDTLDILKEHICPKKSTNSEFSKCQICFKVLANPWSLARHVKCAHKDHVLSKTIDSSTSSTEDKKQIGKKMYDQFYDELDNSAEDNISSFMDFENNLDQSMIVNLQQQIKEEIPPLVKITTSTESTDMAIQPTSNIDLVKGVRIRTPVKASVARALASKLNERYQKKVVNSNDYDNESQLSFDQNDQFSTNQNTLKRKFNKHMDDEDETLLIDSITKINDKKMKIKKGITNIRNTETVRPFVCDICGKAYAKKDGLIKHKIIHENRFFYCTFCSHSPLKSSDSLRRHFKINHQDQQDIWRKKGFANDYIIQNPNIKIDNCLKKITTNDIKIETIEEEFKYGGEDDNNNNKTPTEILENNLNNDNDISIRTNDFFLNKKLQNNNINCLKEFDNNNINKKSNNKVPKNVKKKSNCDSLLNNAKYKTKPFINSTKVTNKQQQNLLNKNIRTNNINNNNSYNNNNKLNTNTVQRNNILINNQNNLLSSPNKKDIIYDEDDVDELIESLPTFQTVVQNGFTTLL